MTTQVLRGEITRLAALHGGWPLMIGFQTATLHQILVGMIHEEDFGDSGYVPLRAPALVTWNEEDGKMAVHTMPSFEPPYYTNPSAQGFGRPRVEIAEAYLEWKRHTQSR